MPKLTDQEFDNLFRQAANRISPEHSAGDWEDMEHRLKAAERDARARNISLYSMVVLLLLYSFLMPENLKFGRYDHASLMPAMEQKEIQSLTLVDEKDGMEKSTKATELTDATGKTETIVKAETTVKGEHSSLETPGTTDGETTVDPAGSPAGSYQEVGALLSSRDRRSETKASRITGGGQQTTLTNKERFSETMPGTTAGQSVSLMARENPESDLLKAPSTDALSVVPETPGNVPMPVFGRVTHVQGVRHPWFVKMSVSPDFSSISFGGSGKTGFNAGPLVEYGISARFSVSTGAIWSKKLYDQKNPAKSYGQGGYTVHADMLNGDCRILDIPLNVTYYLLPGRRTNLFVTVGSSSYIMLDEEYVYTVTRNNNDYEYVENYSNKNNEWFSMLNLSVGVQHQVGKRWFVQGEPFLKAPMKGVGEGKVNLVSAGVFVSVKYWINP